MEGLESVVSQHVLDDIRKKYIQNTNIQINQADHLEMVEQMTRVNQEMSALIFLISSRSSSSNLPAISKKGNLFDFKG